MATILVIDDDEMVRTMLLHTLDRNGHTGVGAADGLEGMARVREHAVDLVITDIFMPNQEGLATIMELRRTHPEIPVIAISGGGARASLDVLPVAEALGARRTLRKPFTPAEVMDAIAAALGGGG